ncbi:uncharacterized protein PRCAT00000001001 [Priceomyces carsonii]|uniref:uncharacterized protein n=1 Tax=Priceomyces carsonii TaxID=28549 RepID=UPI002ED825B8|nr:unnamed protein product [Priceomyces carsonii]
MEVFTKDDFSLSSKNRKKKRRRAVKLCSNCRARKTKCDLKRPTCTTCLVKGINHCEYTASNPYAVNLDNDGARVLEKENDNLRLKIKKLEKQSDPQDPINSIKIDVEQFQTIFAKETRSIFCGPTSIRIFLQNLMTSDYYMSKYKSVKEQRKDWKFMHRPKSVQPNSLIHATPIGVLIELENFLPEYSILLEYVMQFFNGFWFRFLPIVDRDEVLQTFRTQFKLSHSNMRYEIVMPDNSQGFASLALLLTILKFSLNSDSHLYGVTFNKFEDENDILLEFITKLLDHAQYLIKTTLPSLQALLMLRIFKMFNTKDGDGGDGSNGNITFAICFEMGITLGLHQNIDRLYYKKSDNNRSVLKNLWKHLLFYDTINSFNLGVPFHLSNKCLRKDLLDKDDILVGTTLMMRKYLNIILSPNLTYYDVMTSLEDVRSFVCKSFKPSFELIREFGTTFSLDASYDIVLQFFLSNYLLAMIQHGYSLLYYVLKDTNKELSRGSHNLATKYAMLLVIPYVEFIKKAKLLDSGIYSRATRNEIYTFLMGMESKWRAMVFCFFSLLTVMKSEKKNVENSITLNHFVLKLSELTVTEKETQNIYDEEYGETKNAISLIMVITRYIDMLVFLDTNGEKKPGNLVKCINNYSLFLINALVNSFKLFLEQEPKFKLTPDFDQIKIDIIYDIIEESYPSYVNIKSSFDPLSVLNVFEEELVDYFRNDFFAL